MSKKKIKAYIVGIVFGIASLIHYVYFIHETFN